MLILSEAKNFALVKSVRFFTSLSITALCALALAPLVSFAQETPTPTPAPSASPTDEEIHPTFETQKLARTYVLDIPAPRGQITDRNGEPLAQNKLGYTSRSFIRHRSILPTCRCSFLHVRESNAPEKLLGRKLKISDDLILRHYHNRGVLPFEIAPSLTAEEKDDLKGAQGVIVRPMYLRTYPNGSLAGQVIGYAGKTGRMPGWVHRKPRGVLAGNGRTRGAGANVQRHAHRPAWRIQTDLRQGRAQNVGENRGTPPVPGYNVVTTLDLHLQELAEKALEAKAKRGAIVIIDPNTGDILAMASWPTYDPNVFIPVDLGREISRNCRTIRTFRCCRALIVPLIRRDRPSK